MEDRRIIKTKKILKKTLVEMLQKEPFERISITGLCARAEISRITFYAHYSDKYALVDEIFQDMITIGTTDYEKLEKLENKENDQVLSYCHILDAIMGLYYRYFDFFRCTAPDKNPYLAFAFYSIVLETVEQHTKKLGGKHQILYSPKKIAGFLCYGMIGFINEGHKDKVSVEQSKKEAKELLMGVLKSGTLMRI